MFKPTREQEEINDVFEQMMLEFNRDYRKLVINAGAGTGKTTTLVGLAKIAESMGKKGRFLAFNKAIVDAAASKMPANVKCSTFHGYFFGIVGRFYQHRSAKISAGRTAEILGITDDLELSEKNLTPVMQARIIYRAVNKFSMSDDMEIGPWHIGYIRGLSAEDMEVVKATITPLLRKAWQDIASKDGRLRFKPENYIKIGALSSPKIAASFVMVDEAQDTFPVILGWLKRQPHVRLVIVGDKAQSINEWTGAIDAMDKFHGKDENGNAKDYDVVYRTLSKSFRFGPELADEANRWLYVLNGGDFFLEGNENKTTIVTDNPTGIYDAILCRTNAGVVNAAMWCVGQNIKTSMSKRNMDDIKAIAEAAIQLMAGTSTDYEDFAAFQSWDEVLDYVANDPGGEDIKVIVNLVEKYGAESLLNLSDSMVPPEMAQTQVLTAHTSKGLEFPRVMIWNDFEAPKSSVDKDPEPEDIFPEDAKLAYVAITRGMEEVCRGGLSYIDDYVMFGDEEEEDEEEDE